MRDDPVGVKRVVVIVSVVPQLTVQDVGLNVAVAPGGRPEIANEVFCGMPESKVALMVLLPDAPCTAAMSPLLVITYKLGT